MKTLKIVALAAAIATTGLTMQAQGFGYHDSFDQHRIHEGLGSGRLNPWEARRLERNEAFIRSERFRLMRDGYLSPRDRAYLHSLEMRQSASIYRESHDRDFR